MIISKNMKEYKYRKLKCLRDSETGEPIRIYMPVDELDRYNEIAAKAYNAGKNMREVLTGEVIND